MTPEEIKLIVQGELKGYLSDSKVDDFRVTADELEYLVNNKVDARNIVDYTFSGTSAVSFDHNLGRVPTGFIILNQTQAAYISGNMTAWTARRVTLTSSVANNKVRLLFL